MTLHVGFTGTSRGMTAAQRSFVLGLLRQLVHRHGQVCGHHGDDVGADAEFHDLMRMLPNATIVVHPPVDDTRRARCAGDEMRPPLTHFARNRQIVEEADVVVGAPFESEHQDRGGAWYTIDHANKRGKPLVVVAPLPAGEVAATYHGEWARLADREVMERWEELP